MLVFAHRGASVDAPENTLLAIQEAINQRAHGIEIDVQQVGNELIVFHDRVLSRTTNGSGLLKDHNLTELQKLDAGLGQRIPTLWQVLTLINGQCLLNIEVKGAVSPELLDSYIQRAIQQLNFSFEQFIVSSFDHHFLKEFKTYTTDIRIGAITASKPLQYAEFAEELGAYSVNIDMTVLDKEFVTDAKNRGLKIMVYTVDNPQELQKLLAWKVDCVFCNAPKNAMNIIKRVE
ncbi:glycerophosphodiester phosphodiesterase [Paraglaciecola sp.]|uniref:glycerophosphodiester phosphodiesterase n=1 Tax=Paraglaciecola sp. TaxID=1920173 RepID=UPI003EF80D0D